MSEININKFPNKTLHSCLAGRQVKLYALNLSSGQALVSLLFFVIITITITSAAIAMMIINATTTSNFSSGNLAYHIAESGAENALLRLLRDPSYTGEVLTVGNGSATIQVTGSNPNKTIVSTGQLGNFSRKIQVQVQYTNNVLTINSWQEIP